MALYKEIWQRPDDPTVIGWIKTDTGTSIFKDAGGPEYRELLTWLDAGGVADPAFTQPEIVEADRQERQAGRVMTLKSAVIEEFRMILNIFQVGRDKGLWTVADFDPDVVAKATAWKQLIDEYDADT
jgi:hypothetical protein